MLKQPNCFEPHLLEDFFDDESKDLISNLPIFTSEADFTSDFYEEEISRLECLHQETSLK